MMVSYMDPFATLSREIDKVFYSKPTVAYPPYNIVKVDDDNFVMEFAIAGFAKDEINISVDKGVLHIDAEKAETDEKHYLHKGIAARKFARAFTLPEYFEVSSAEMQDGILNVALVRNIPEEKKPKTIAIN